MTLFPLLAGKDVHVLALCLVDTTDSTIIRLVVDYPRSRGRRLPLPSMASTTVWSKS